MSKKIAALLLCFGCLLVTSRALYLLMTDEASFINCIYFLGNLSFLIFFIGRLLKEENNK